ncbi:MAG: hypothetical protein AVDCRST_MAG88-4474, partial [uncultured Thermomicrobiales bacterium]
CARGSRRGGRSATRWRSWAASYRTSAAAFARHRGRTRCWQALTGHACRRAVVVGKA